MQTGCRLRMTILAAGLIQPAYAVANTPDTSPVRDAVETVQGARKVMMNDPATALTMARDLERRVANSPDEAERREATAKAKWIAGEAMLRLNRIDAAQRLINSSYASAVASKDLQSQGDSLLSRGSIKIESGDPAGALKDFLMAYRLFLRTGDTRSQSITLQDLAALYTNAQDYSRAEQYLRQAAEAYSKEPMLQLALASNIGTLLLEQKRYDRAEIELRRGVGIARDMGASALEVNILSNLVIGQIEQHRLRDASGSVEEALRVSRRAGLPISDALRSAVARLAYAKGEIGLAQRHISELFGEPSSKQTMSYKEMHYSAYQIYRAAGKKDLALAHFEIAARLRAEATALSISNKALLMAAKFDFSSQELRIAKLRANKLQADVANQHADTARQRTILLVAAIAIIMVLALLSAGLLVLRRSRDRANAANARLGQANAALEAALHEVGQRAKAEQHATQLAEHDVLTGLPNRRHLNEAFSDGSQPRDNPEIGTSLLLLDLDRFKPINDIYGHEVGDLVLVVTADRLRTLCSQNDAKVVRLGGDEFVVLMTAPAGDAAPRQLASQIIHHVSAPIDVSGRRLTVGASVGIARYPQDGLTTEELLRAADIAMYEAKRSGRKTFCFFDAAMGARLRSRADTEADLRNALTDGQIMAHFQPIHCFRTDAITGFEALARWQHADRGMVPPDEFISIAEEVGLIEEVTDAILRQACDAARDWPNHFSVSVNLSPVLLRDPWITAKIFGILTHARLPPERLIIEVTETGLIDDLALASDVLSAFRAAGIRIAMDDFGKGYSSLSQLRELNFDHIKLDASFVLTLEQDESMKITTAVAGLGQALGMPVTAEGVETAETGTRVRALGFSYAQGYFYGRAVPREKARLIAWGKAPPVLAKREQLARAGNA